ncbi:MAG TPA: polyamine aminopropyltransferase [Dehalococcoidales bacterium]|nr:polyamine aminopropyltransferase [Dehalococcoidales bacterium]
MDTDPSKWFHDRISRNFIQLHSFEETLYTGQTKFQSAEVIRSSRFGKFLALDGKIQSSEMDEFIYHEALVQPSMITHPCPETVFIAGGGEGATLREVLSHKTVKRAVMVDIDDEVIALCKQYLPNHSHGSFEDRRTELRHTDARDYLAKSGEKFDVVIIDLPDPLEEGPAYLLYTKEFYKLAQDRLADNGIICTQAGSASLTELLNFTAVNNTLKSVFPIVCPYQVDVPCFGGPWGFCLASPNLNPALLSPAEVDNRISARSLTGLKFYDGLTHQGMFSLPKYLREALAKQKRLITDKDPLYLYRD